MATAVSTLTFVVPALDQPGGTLTVGEKAISLVLGPVLASGTSTARPPADRFAETANVRDFGAKGDGTTDDTAAIQAAVNSTLTGLPPFFSPVSASNGGKVFLPAGSYKVTAPIALKRGVSICGASKESSRLLNFGTGSVLVYADNGRDIPDEVTVRDLAIIQDSGTVALSGAGIDVGPGPAAVQAVTMHVQRVLVNGTFYGIRLQAGIGCSVRDSIVERTENHGIYIQFGGASPTGTTSTTLQNNYTVLSKAGDGVRIESGTYITVLGCGSDSNFGNGYFVDGGDSIAIVECGAEGNGRNPDGTGNPAETASAYVKNCGNVFVSVRGVETTAGTRHGIILENAARVSVHNTRVSWSGSASGYGIRLVSGGTDVVCANVGFISPPLGLSDNAIIAALLGFKDDISPRLFAAADSPEGVITAAIGSIYLRTNGGAATTLYVKESGTGNTGWVAK